MLNNLGNKDFIYKANLNLTVNDVITAVIYIKVNNRQVNNGQVSANGLIVLCKNDYREKVQWLQEDLKGLSLLNSFSCCPSGLTLMAILSMEPTLCQLYDQTHPWAKALGFFEPPILQTIYINLS